MVIDVIVLFSHDSYMGEMTGIAFIDSTPIEVCHPCRARSHKVFGDLPQ